MKLNQSQLVKVSIVGALLMLGAGTSNALAGPNRGHHRHTNSCGCVTPEYAGRLVIDGCTTRIRSDRPMLGQIVKAFRSAGYDAWIHDGCVRVDYGCDRPSVRWYRDRYSARLNWDYGELGISLRTYRPSQSWNRVKRVPIRSARRSVRRSYCD